MFLITRCESFQRIMSNELMLSTSECESRCNRNEHAWLAKFTSYQELKYFDKYHKILSVHFVCFYILSYEK